MPCFWKINQRVLTPWNVADVQADRFLARFIGCAILVLIPVLHATAGAQRYAEPIFSDVHISMDIPYGAREEHQLDVYKPDGDTEVNRAAVLLIHGGGFAGGDKRHGLYMQMATAFARHGYVAFSINYRLADPRHNPAIPDTAVTDALTALNWIKANHVKYGIDPRKITIGGDSAGGFISVNLSYRNAGSIGAAACINLWGGMYSAPSGTWDAPIYSDPIEPGTPPTLLIHGTADRLVPYQTSLDLADALAVAKVYHEVHPLEGADHYPFLLTPRFIPIMVDFAYRFSLGVE